jgi:hypothetical protein
MTIQTAYTDSAAKAQDVASGATDLWARGIQKLFSVTPPAGRLDPTGPIDWYFDTAAKVLEQQRDYVKTLAGTMSLVQGAAREQAVSMASILRDQAASASNVMRTRADDAEQLADDEAREAELQARREARQAKREARAAAAEKFADMTKAELQDELAARELPKTGNVDELRDRLIDAELEADETD